MTTDSPKVLVVIAGPTASGKTATGVNVAKALCTEILSADSRQFYKELHIGVARPSEEELAAVPHHFIGHISIRDEYNVSRFEADALGLLDSLFRTHSHVVLVGGSGLYVRAVCHGIDVFPETDPSVREQLNQGFARYGIQYLLNRLLDLDPDYYMEVDRHNHMRLIRALEVCISTGLPYSSFLQNTSAGRPFRVVQFGLEHDRNVLYERINCRVDEMFSGGVLEEARELYPQRHLNALNTLGYRELFDHLDGHTGLEETREQIKTNTRRYARKQLTWFRKEPGIRWVTGDFSRQILDSLR
jgi:tRNA dimethylallyltransferase